MRLDSVITWFYKGCFGYWAIVHWEAVTHAKYYSEFCMPKYPLPNSQWPIAKAAFIELQCNLDIMNGRDWLNLFSVTRFRYIEVFFHIFTVTGVKQNSSLYRGLLYRGSIVYMLCFNVILSSNFVFFCFKLTSIHYFTHKRREIKFKSE